MKKSKLIGLWALTFVTGAVVGGACLCAYLPGTARTNPVSYRAQNGLDGAQLPSLEEATLLPGVSEVADDEPVVKSSADIPTHLVRSNLPEDMVLGTSTPQSHPVSADGVLLNDAQNTVVLNAQRPATRASDQSNITMIQAPVGVKRISTLDQYKKFKQQARGSYPVADFAKEDVIVLESTSNLPDKVFEIVSAQPDGKNLKVVYRVNMFGLDKKTNTHSALKVKKSNLPIVLEQVL